MNGSRSRILSHTDVRVSDAPVRVGESSLSSAAAMEGATSTDGHDHPPQLSVDHDAHGNVTRIHIRCQCGEDITICCDYPDAA